MRATPAEIAQTVTGVAAAVALMSFFDSVLIPFTLAGVLAMLVSTFARRVERRWPAAPDWATITLTGTVITVATAAGAFVIVSGGIRLFHDGPALVQRLDQLVGDIGRWVGVAEPVHIRTLAGRVSVPQLAGRLLAAFQSIASGLVLTLIFLPFMLLARARMSGKLKRSSASAESAAAIETGVSRMEGEIETYIWVQTVTGAMIAGASGALMFALGLDNALFWTIALFLLTYIPVIGVTVGSIAPALFALLQYQTLWQGVAIFAGVQAAAFVVGNFIYPRMQADTQNISPVATMLALALWTVLWGVPGAFLAVPLTLVLMMVCAQFDSSRWLAVFLSNDGRPRGVPASRPRRRVKTTSSSE